MNRCPALVFVAALTSFAYGADYPSSQAPRLRLSEVQDVAPLSYEVQLSLDPTKDDFRGSIVIRMDVNKPSQTIWLDAEDIKITSATLNAGGRSQSATILPGGEDFVGFQFGTAAPAGRAELKITYTGRVNGNNSAAIFRQQDNENWYIFSQFESTDARRAFPCFDEPSYKTPWHLTLRVPAGDTAVSNTLPESDRRDGPTRTVEFRETKPLPSYLVAFAVGPFEYVPAGFTADNHVPVRIVVPKGHGAEARYAAEVTAGIINRHEQYFGIPFPYDKADQVSVPNTFGWGAMENPGMVTYWQIVLLAKPEVDTIDRQRSFFTIAAHELAHQWFGDLVTTAWWNDTWLNESFATWFEQKSTAEMHPEWSTTVGDVHANLEAMDEDSLRTARRIRQPIESKGDIENAFDGITYQKGAAVIGMFENWMTPEAFRQGVQAYLKQYSWRATTADDFLRTLGSTWHKDVATPFSSFLNQSGVPLVSVALDCSHGTPSLHLEQERFLPLGSKGSKDETWGIPVCERDSAGSAACTLLTSRSADWKLPTHQCPSWVDANAGAHGYYHVEYKGDLLEKLTSGDVEHRLRPRERVYLVGNTTALASAGKLPISSALGLVETFHNDEERRVLLSALEVATHAHEHLVPARLEPNYRRFLQKNFGARARQLGWTPAENESPDVRLLRAQLVPEMATVGGDQALAAESRKLTERWFTDHKAIEPTMVEPVLRTAAYYGDKQLFKQFLDQYERTQDGQIQRQLLEAMANFRDPEAVRSAFKALVDRNVPFLQGFSLLFSGQTEESTRHMSLQFIESHWDQISSLMPSAGLFDFASSLPEAGRSYCDARSRDELERVLKAHLNSSSGAPLALRQRLESIDLCIAAAQVQRRDMEAFLGKY